MPPRLYIPSTRDLPASRAQRLLDSLLNLLYPDVCFVCSAPVARRQERGICSTCWDKAKAMKIRPPRCSSCGIPFDNPELEADHLCGNCLLQLPPFSGARAYGYYADELSRIVQALKFHARRNLVELLGNLLTETFYENWTREDIDFVVPVPLHPRRKRQRGFNQSELLANWLSRRTAIATIGAIKRIRPTLPQVGLTDAQRAENVRRAFSCTVKTRILDKRVLLIDDVMTTGATVASAARTLLDAGALRVSVLTVARVGKW